jgi:hypothetical protein
VESFDKESGAYEIVWLVPLATPEVFRSGLRVDDEDNGAPYESAPVCVTIVTLSDAFAVALIITFLRFADVGTSSVRVVPAGTLFACPNFFSVRAI